MLLYNMVKRCVICSNIIEEEFGKLKGIMLKMSQGIGKKAEWTFVCSDCQKDSRHIEKAKVRAA